MGDRLPSFDLVISQRRCETVSQVQIRRVSNQKDSELPRIVGRSSGVVGLATGTDGTAAGHGRA